MGDNGAGDIFYGKNDVEDMLLVLEVCSHSGGIVWIHRVTLSRMPPSLNIARVRRHVEGGMPVLGSLRREKNIRRRGLKAAMSRLQPWFMAENGAELPIDDSQRVCNSKRRVNVNTRLRLDGNKT